MKKHPLKTAAKLVPFAPILMSVIAAASSHIKSKETRKEENNPEASEPQRLIWCANTYQQLKNRNHKGVAATTSIGASFFSLGFDFEAGDVAGHLFSNTGSEFVDKGLDEAFEFAVQFVDPSSVSGVANGVGTSLAENVADEIVEDFVEDLLDSSKRNKKTKTTQVCNNKRFNPNGQRIGLIASLQGIRLRPYGIIVGDADFNECSWFLNDEDDVRSSNFLEIVAPKVTDDSTPKHLNILIFFYQVGMTKIFNCCYKAQPAT